MITLAMSCGLGFLFGYGLLGTVVHTYSARAYFPLVAFCVFLIGFMVVVAAIAQQLVLGTTIAPLTALLPALGFWLAYSVAIAAGVSLRVWRRRVLS